MPKHGLQAEETSAKRAKNSETPASRSTTPADMMAQVPFHVRYPPMNTKRKLSKREQELVDNAEWQVSPFVARGASKDGELDQHYTVIPSTEWDEMKKYNNFISECLVINNAWMNVLNEMLQSRARCTKIITSSM
jgi:hypothetical protein